MKVAEKNMIRFDQRFESALDHDLEHDLGKGAGIAYASRAALRHEAEHDARGLIIAILLCVCCWAALGFFLLS